MLKQQDPFTEQRAMANLEGKHLQWQITALCSSPQWSQPLWGIPSYVFIAMAQTASPVLGLAGIKNSSNSLGLPASFVTANTK